jgi:hypothetical protein
MHRGLCAGRKQGFEQLSFEICASTLDDVPVSHGLTIQAYLNSPRTQRQLGYCLSYLDDHATLKLDDISGFRFGDQAGRRDSCAPLKVAQYAYRANKAKSFGAILVIYL